MFPYRIRGLPALLLAVAMGLGACTGEARPPVGTATPQEDSPRSEPSPSPSPEPSPTEAANLCTQKVAYPRPPSDRPRYELRMTVDPGRRLVTGDVTVSFTPDLPTRRLVFRLWPNGPRQAGEGARLSVGRVTARGQPLATVRPEPTTLIAETDHRLAPGDRITVSLPWRLTLPAETFDRVTGGPDWAILGSFFPILAWEPGRGWARTPPTSSLAEASLAPTADFEATIRVPAGLRVIASGTSRDGKHWKATAVRDFAVAAGDFDIATATAHAPKAMRVTVGVESSLGVDPDAWLREAIDAMQSQARRFGPYPWPSFSLAIMPGLRGGGIEYPTLVFQGEESLDFTTPHEMGHMWFYSLVGNDQGVNPWLDESLASWAQAVHDGAMGFYNDYDLPAAATGHLGEPMTYWDAQPDEVYFPGAYVQGVKMLNALGPARKVDCALRIYTAATAYGIARPGDLVRALREVFGGRATAVLREYGAID